MSREKILAEGITMHYLETKSRACSTPLIVRGVYNIIPGLGGLLIVELHCNTFPTPC
jgi:hypothetical protein